MARADTQVRPLRNSHGARIKNLLRFGISRLKELGAIVALIFLSREVFQASKTS